jgi:hypothetical protein
MKRLIYCLLIFTLIDCSHSPRAKPFYNQNTKFSADSIQHFARKESKVVDIRLTKDTLFIVSTNVELYYPFGTYSNFDGFYSEYLIKGNRRCKIDSIQKVFKVIRIQNELSKIELIENTETNKLEILSANINDSSFGFINGIKVGIKKPDVILKFFTNESEDLKEIPVIKVESGLEGIWYYYIFSQDTLAKIIVKTDYTLSK